MIISLNPREAQVVCQALQKYRFESSWYRLEEAEICGKVIKSLSEVPCTR